MRGAKREITWVHFLGIVIVYLAIIQGLGLLLKPANVTSDHQFPDAEGLLRAALIPIMVSAAFTAGVVTWLGWWDEALHDHKPVQRWVWLVPGLMIAAAVIRADYAHLLDEKVSLVLSLVVLVCFIGFTEELMFRGIGVTCFRRGGFSEGKVALWSSVIFGAAHVSNAIGHGPEAFIQAAVVSTSGYFLYLTRRVSGAIFLAMFVHGLWDFSLISAGIGNDPVDYVGAAAPILVQAFLILFLIKRRHRIEPEPTPAPQAP